ncbi:putative quinol monooxygenase [Thalassoglobus sp. JC818]|uniref:putative quinol monooxygenase n=1 Tax=Thalassoglobus sp. JC818 TaxID=3232136 RepID=UPI00345AF622
MFAINVILTVQDGSQIENIAKLLTEAGRLSREEPGCLSFEVCQSIEEKGTFLLIERWESKEAWEVHKTAQAFTEIYQPQVLPLVKRQPYFCEILE